jgi:hypothetical protein
MHCAYAGHSSAVFELQWLPDGRSVASRSEEQRVQIWDAATGDQEQVLAYGGTLAENRRLVWSPSREFLAFFTRAEWPPATRKSGKLAGARGMPSEGGRKQPSGAAPAPTVIQPTSASASAPAPTILSASMPAPTTASALPPQPTLPLVQPELLDESKTLVVPKLQGPTGTVITTKRPRGRPASKRRVARILPRRLS